MEHRANSENDLGVMISTSDEFVTTTGASSLPDSSGAQHCSMLPHQPLITRSENDREF
jgi:hypothetical protein